MRILYLVDCQKDFMDKNGALYVPGAEEIKQNIVKLLDEHWDMIIYSLDTHNKNYKNTEEGKMFPEHCIIGTTGHELFDELKLKLNERKKIIPVIELRKNYFDVWIHKENKRLLKRLIHDEDKVVFAGVATNYCVFYAMKGMYDHINCRMEIRMDCTKAIKDDSYEQTMRTIEFFLKNNGSYYEYDDINKFVKKIIYPNIRKNFKNKNELFEYLCESDKIDNIISKTSYHLIGDLHYFGTIYISEQLNDYSYNYNFAETIMCGIAYVLQDCNLVTLKSENVGREV